jgi:NADH-quinone oxidoreductase subunit J
MIFMATTFAFYVLATLGVGCALFLHLGVQSVHAVLALVGAFVVGALLCLGMDADFFGFTLLLVYVGAIAVLFLFVLMMLNLNEERLLERAEPAPTSPSFVVGLCVVLLLYGILQAAILPSFPTPLPTLGIGPDPLFAMDLLSDVEDQTTLVTIGLSLFGPKATEVLIAGLVLLVAMIGAIHLTLEKNATTKTQNPVGQMMREVTKTTVKAPR